MPGWRHARLLLIAAIGLGDLALATAAPAEESLGDKLKKIFNPTPTPKPRKRKSSASAKKKSPTPKAKSSPKSSPSPSPKSSPTASPSPAPTAKKKKKKKASPSPTETPSPSPDESPTASPSPTGSPSPDESPSPTASPSPEESPTASPSPKRSRAPGAAITPEKIEDFEEYKPEVKRLLESAMALTQRDLDYKYGSADPANGGMDCSGFIYYVLRENGFKEVPRDSSQQYTWLRKAGRFEAVMSESDKTFELDNLKPGDLLFWTGTYDIKRDPPITHTMIYLGREKGTNRRVMVGASDGRTYQDESRYGVSVFDFKVSRPGRPAANGRTPRFIGYGHLPGLHE